MTPVSDGPFMNPFRNWKRSAAAQAAPAAQTAPAAPPVPVVQAPAAAPLVPVVQAPPAVPDDGHTGTDATDSDVDMGRACEPVRVDEGLLNEWRKPVMALDPLIILDLPRLVNRYKDHPLTWRMFKQVAKVVHGVEWSCSHVATVDANAMMIPGSPVELYLNATFDRLLCPPHPNVYGVKVTYTTAGMAGVDSALREFREAMVKLEEKRLRPVFRSMVKEGRRVQRRIAEAAQRPPPAPQERAPAQMPHLDPMRDSLLRRGFLVPNGIGFEPGDCPFSGFTADEAKVWFAPCSPPGNPLPTILTADKLKNLARYINLNPRGHAARHLALAVIATNTLVKVECGHIEKVTVTTFEGDHASGSAANIAIQLSVRFSPGRHSDMDLLAVDPSYFGVANAIGNILVLMGSLGKDTFEEWKQRFHVHTLPRVSA
jgi:hypothetical protein